jgi:hypothetical protein
VLSKGFDGSARDEADAASSLAPHLTYVVHNREIEHGKVKACWAILTPSSKYYPLSECDSGRLQKYSRPFFCVARSEARFERSCTGTHHATFARAITYTPPSCGRVLMMVSNSASKSYR